MKNNEQIRLDRTRKFYGVTTLLLFVVFIYLLWVLNTILIPVIIGFLAAYLCLPILKKLKGKGISRTASVFILFSGFIIAIILLFQLVSMAIPDQEGIIELKATLQFNLQDKYQSMMGLKQDETEGNFLYRITGNELDPIVHEISCYLKLDSNEKEVWQQLVQNGHEDVRLAEGYEEVNRTLICHDDMDTTSATTLNSGNLIPGSASNPPILASVFQFLSVWFIMPFVFIYALLDNGKARKKLIYLIPNAYFEVTLTTLHSVNKAIGTYLRCLVSNILIVGGLFALLLRIIGFDMAPAILIGLLNGILNAIPLIGSIVGLIIILVYAIVIEHPATILPFIDRDSIILWAFFVYLIIQVIDNAILKPVLMGKAINLNPVIIIFAAIGGAFIGGFIGILLAIPVVLIVKVGFTTLRNELRRYFFIY